MSRRLKPALRSTFSNSWLWRNLIVFITKIIFAHKLSISLPRCEWLYEILPNHLYDIPSWHFDTILSLLNAKIWKKGLLKFIPNATTSCWYLLTISRFNITFYVLEFQRLHQINWYLQVALYSSSFVFHYLTLVVWQFALAHALAPVNVLVFGVVSVWQIRMRWLTFRHFAFKYILISETSLIEGDVYAHAFISH